ncbi:MAG: NHL repeat-containing protein [Candidatus Zixiibacteriota bacterium]
MKLLGLGGIALLISAGLLISVHAETESRWPRVKVTAVVYDDGWQSKLRNPSGLFFDRQAGELFVADAGNHRVLIFDQNLVPKYSFEHFVHNCRADHMVRGEPRTLVVNSLGEIILIDNLVNYLDVLDFRGKPLEKVHLNRVLKDTTLSVKPQSLSIDQSDNLYVAVVGDLTTVIVLDKYYELKRTIGTKGTDRSDFNTPLRVYVQNGLLYITDLYAEPAVKVFDTTGEFKYGFGGHEVERSDFSFPTGVMINEKYSGQKSIWVVDGLRQVVKVFDDQGEFVTYVGGFGFNQGEFRYPSDIAAASDSVFFVAERVGNRIQRFEIR